MQLCRAHIRNFRAIEEATLEVGQHTVIIGGNGIGKSCALKAIDKFFAKTPSVSPEDFHNKNINDPIEITLTFRDFTPEELEQFAGRIHGNEMVVTRVLSIGLSSRENGKFFGQAPRHAAFQDIRVIEGALSRRQAYSAIRLEDGYHDLPAATAEAQVLAGMEAWEAQHPESCELSRDDGQFFGFTNVGRGILQKYLSFVFIPAVRDAGSDSIDKGNSVVAQLIELLVKTVVQRREEFKQWQIKTTAEYQELGSGPINWVAEVAIG